MFVTNLVDQVFFLVPSQRNNDAQPSVTTSQMYCDICNRKLFAGVGFGAGASPGFLDFHSGVIQESREGPEGPPGALSHTPLLAAAEG